MTFVFEKFGQTTITFFKNTKYWMFKIEYKRMTEA